MEVRREPDLRAELFILQERLENIRQQIRTTQHRLTFGKNPEGRRRARAFLSYLRPIERDVLERIQAIETSIESPGLVERNLSNEYNTEGASILDHFFEQTGVTRASGFITALGGVSLVSSVLLASGPIGWAGAALLALGAWSAVGGTWQTISGKDVPSPIETPLRKLGVPSLIGALVEIGVEMFLGNRYNAFKKTTSLAEHADEFVRAPKPNRLGDAVDVGEFADDRLRMVDQPFRKNAPNRRVLSSGTSSHGERLLDGGIDAAQGHFDDMLVRTFRESDAGEFQGIWMNRQVSNSQFSDVDLAIYIQRESHLTGRIVGEEVQHALDFTMGGTRRRIAAEAAARNIPDDELGRWWHRRVFTRQLQNVHGNRHGMGVLQPYSDDIYRAYQSQGGRLSLEEILSRTFNGLF